MPLEFPCPNCQHLLRTADDKAGLSATCPACGESLWVPYAHQLGAQTNEPSPPPVPDDEAARDEYVFADDDPFAADSTTKTPSPDAENPFADQLFPRSSDDEQDSEQHESDGFEADEAPRPHRGRSVVTCEHCGTENEPGEAQCRQCAADLPASRPVAHQDGWQPREPDVGEILQSSWKIFTDEIGLLIGAMFLFMLVSMGIAIVCMIPMGIGAAIAAAVDDELVPIGVMAGMFLVLPLILAVGTALHVGYLQLNLNAARGLPAGIGDLFYGFGEGRSQILPLIVVGLLGGFVVLFTCTLAQLIVWPLGILVVHRRTNIGDGVSMGIELIQKEFVNILLIGLIFMGINMAIGMLNMCFYIGFILMVFAYPYLMMLQAVGYLRIDRERIAVDRD